MNSFLFQPLRRAMFEACNATNFAVPVTSTEEIIEQKIRHLLLDARTQGLHEAFPGISDLSLLLNILLTAQHLRGSEYDLAAFLERQMELVRTNCEWAVEARQFDIRQAYWSIGCVLGAVLQKLGRQIPDEFKLREPTPE